MSQFKSETLQTLVDRLLIETNTSTYEVARKSKGAISQSMVDKIRNGGVKNPSVTKLQGLADGLNVPLQILLDAANQTKPNASLIRNERLANISLRFDGLPSDKQKKAEMLIEMMEREIERIANEK